MMTIGKKLHEKVKPHAKRIAGIAHPHRLAILYLLAHDPMWVRDLVNYLGLPENLISHHLKQMYEAGWVSKEKQGRTVTYRLNEKTFFDLPKLLLDTPFWRDTFLKTPKSR
ncbi:MAG: metalloregulator ArsR/SmtB family transcription factor [Patescibacteria group bacterium]